jgi:hypothetical protein
MARVLGGLRMRKTRMARAQTRATNPAIRVGELARGEVSGGGDLLPIFLLIRFRCAQASREVKERDAGLTQPDQKRPG